MNRQQVQRDMENAMGMVPTFFKQLPDSTLELEWELYKKTHMESSAIPNKYRELIGLGVAAATKCKYCLFYHTEMAKLNGASQAEIEDAVHYAKSSAGWSTYVSGLQLDFDQFQKEVLQVCEHVRSSQLAKV